MTYTLFGIQYVPSIKQDIYHQIGSCDDKETLERWFGVDVFKTAYDQEMDHGMIVDNTTGEKQTIFKSTVITIELSDSEKIRQAIEVAFEYAGIDGAHHKMWTIDQMLRILLGKDYRKTISERNEDKDYDPWDVGIAP